MEDLYRENILDHFRNPRNFGTLEHPDFSHEEHNPLCGDKLRIDLQVDDDRVTAVRFSGKGCAISQASASMLTEMVEGKTLEEVKSIDKQDILDALGIPISYVRIKCALLGLKTLKAGVYGVQTWVEEDNEQDIGW
ncbi:MAG: SUF system NifU family Fe-S cluster assembly protein [Chloroflexi bacterium]|nr:SUF system NifU family Fe-S cluster assembly protein [Chloroflexota bacterium]